MGVLCSFSDLKHAIIHDINTLERYDDEVAEGHILSVIILKKASRKSDMLFFDKKVFVMLMPATDKSGAEHIFSQMHEVCKRLENLSILSYPQDAFTDDAFYQKISDEIKMKER